MAIIIYNFNLGQQIGAAAFRLSAGHLASPRQFLALQCPLCDLQPCLPAMTCARPIILQAPPAHFPISRHFPQFPPAPKHPGQTCAKSFRFWPPTATRTFMFCCRPMLFFLLLFLVCYCFCFSRWFCFRLGLGSPQFPQEHNAPLLCFKNSLFTLSKISLWSAGRGCPVAGSFILCTVPCVACSQIFRYLILCG